MSSRRDAPRWVVYSCGKTNEHLPGMNMSSNAMRIPSVDALLRDESAAPLIDTYGRRAVTDAIREDLTMLRTGAGGFDSDSISILGRVEGLLEDSAAPSLKRVFNLTGTVIHTNLGRAPLPEVAADAMHEAAMGAVNLEYDLDKGRRGDRDAHLEDLICELTGAEAATVVNNNAAAVLLTLSALARRREVPVSRGELIEIGGSFRMPDIMKSAGVKLVEVGTTNRTHAKDYEGAMSARTAMIMKVHMANYRIEGFTAEVEEKTLADIAHRHGVPFVVDLGSGTLTDFERLGLPHEPTPMQALATGADIVTFSGDKLLGGPQAGIICGRKDLVAKIRKNPMKRALRLGKVSIAGLSAVLSLYRDPDRLEQRLPVLRLLTRDAVEIEAQARRLMRPVLDALGGAFSVQVVACQSQVGSGALPVEQLPSWGLALTPSSGGRGKVLDRLAAKLRGLPKPVIGRIADGALLLDLRCLAPGDEQEFVEQLLSGDKGET